MQSYNLNKADTAIAISGSQNVSFSYDSDQLTQRIDRIYKPSGKSYFRILPLMEEDTNVT